jgi:hypothetical protein
VLRQQMRKDQLQFKYKLKSALKDSEVKKAEIESLKSDLQKARSSPSADQTMIIKEEQVVFAV